MKKSFIPAAFAVLLSATSMEAKTLILTMGTCYRSAAIGLMDFPGTNSSPSYTINGWFAPSSPMSIEAKDNTAFYLHVSFWDHGIFASNRFTRNDAAFCVAKTHRNFTTKSLKLMGAGSCEPAQDLVKLENFEKIEIKQEVTTIDICEI